MNIRQRTKDFFGGGKDEGLADAGERGEDYVKVRVKSPAFSEGPNLPF